MVMYLSIIAVCIVIFVCIDRWMVNKQQDAHISSAGSVSGDTDEMDEPCLDIHSSGEPIIDSAPASFDDPLPLLDSMQPRLRSIAALIGSFVASIMLIIELRSLFINLLSIDTADTYAAAGAGLALLLTVPHYLLFGIGCLLHWIGYGARIRGLLLASAILYSVALLFGLQFFLTMLLPVVLGYVGYANQLRLDRQWQASIRDH